MNRQIRRDRFRNKAIRSLFVWPFALSVGAGAWAATWDLSLAPFETQASFTKLVTFSGGSAIAYDFSYPAGAPPATLTFHFRELGDGTTTDIRWTNMTIINGANTASYDLTNQPRNMCGPDILPARPFPGGGSIALEDGPMLKFSIVGMRPASFFQILFSGSVVGTALIKGAYEVEIERVLLP